MEPARFQRVPQSVIGLLLSGHRVPAINHWPPGDGRWSEERDGEFHLWQYSKTHVVIPALIRWERAKIVMAQGRDMTARKDVVVAAIRGNQKRNTHEIGASPARIHESAKHSYYNCITHPSVRSICVACAPLGAPYACLLQRHRYAIASSTSIHGDNSRCSRGRRERLHRCLLQRCDRGSRCTRGCTSQRKQCVDLAGETL